MTSYGYAPPPGATASGWRCPDATCGWGEDTVPHRWPFACTQCGGATDPVLDDPWAHDAREPWLRHEVAVAEPGMREFWLAESIVWRHCDAVRKGDREAADLARAEGLRWVADHADDPYVIPGRVHLPIVLGALRREWIDSAADELAFWIRHVRVPDGEADNTRRTDSRQLLSGLLSFLEHPASAHHPRTTSLRGAAVQWRDAIVDDLSSDLERRSRHLHVHGFVPAGEPVAPPTDLVDQLEAFGRFSFDPMASDLDASLVWERIVAPHFDSAQADPGRFCRALAGVAVPRDGWVVYGAQRLVVELLGGDCRELEFLRMQDAALAWLRRSGVTADHLTGYEHRRRRETHGSLAWRQT